MIVHATVMPIRGLAGDAESAIQLTDVTRDVGMTFRHTDGSSGRRYIPETVTAGLALFDFDSDGDADVYFLNGAPLKGTRADPPPRNALYRNDGSWRFTDVTDSGQVGDRGFGLGIAAADYDNDGFLDFYVSNAGPNALYHNNGDGTFSNVTQMAGVADGDKVGAGVCFLDMDSDGDPDLYVANYVKFTYATHVARTLNGIPEYSGPKDYPAEPDTLFCNNGDGTFSDVSEVSGIREQTGSGMGIVASDCDQDGDTDVFVLNDVSGNFLFLNDGTGHFQESGLAAGVGFNLNGAELGSMGLDCGDYDNDGRLDFYMTSYARELPVLYRNLGDGFFQDVTLLTGAGLGLYPHVNWGVGFIDFDNDGYRDLFVACGHLQDNIEQRDDSTAYLVRNVLLRNLGNGKFKNVSDQSGSGLVPKLSSRGAVFDDLDTDGDIDVVVLNSRRESTLIRNDSPNNHTWLQVRLRGLQSNRDGIGARVHVVAGKLSQVAEVHSGRGYQSHFGLSLHFGLKEHRRVDRIEVHWIDGRVDVLHDIPVNERLNLYEGLDPS